MIPSVVVFVLLVSTVVDVLVNLQGCIMNKKSAQTRSAIAVANSVWARLSNFNRTIIGMAFCCFTHGPSLSYPLKVCPNNNENGQSGSPLGSSLKYALKALDRYPMVTLTDAVTSLFFGPC